MLEHQISFKIIQQCHQYHLKSLTLSTLQPSSLKPFFSVLKDIRHHRCLHDPLALPTFSACTGCRRFFLRIRVNTITWAGPVGGQCTIQRVKRMNAHLYIDYMLERLKSTNDTLEIAYEIIWCSIQIKYFL